MTKEQTLQLLDILANVIAAAIPDRNDLGEALTNLRTQIADTHDAGHAPGQD